MISNLLLLASDIYINVDAMRILKGFVSSKILHLCFYSLGHQFHMLDLLQLQEPGLNYVCYRNLADWPDGCRKLIFKSCSTLHSLTTPIYHFSSYLHATYLFRRRESVVIVMNVKWTRKCIIFCCTFICIGIYWFEEMVTSCSWYSPTQGKSLFFNSSQTSFILSIEI